MYPMRPQVWQDILGILVYVGIGIPSVVISIKYMFINTTVYIFIAKDDV